MYKNDDFLITLGLLAVLAVVWYVMVFVVGSCVLP